MYSGPGRKFGGAPPRRGGIECGTPPMGGAIECGTPHMGGDIECSTPPMGGAIECGTPPMWGAIECGTLPMGGAIECGTPPIPSGGRGIWCGGCGSIPPIGGRTPPWNEPPGGWLNGSSGCMG